jgi:hypothetical protein
MAALRIKACEQRRGLCVFRGRWHGPIFLQFSDPVKVSSVPNQERWNRYPVPPHWDVRQAVRTSGPSLVTTIECSN